jgi:hypothetical protein
MLDAPELPFGVRHFRERPAQICAQNNAAYPAFGDDRCGRDVAKAESARWFGQRFPFLRRDRSRSPVVVARLRPWRVKAR